MIKSKHKNFSGGFTLIETLVAVSIFTLSILAVMTISSKGISDTNYVKKKMGATYLAQEGIESMRNMRDTYMLYHASGSVAGWTAFKSKFPASCQTSDGCYFSDENVSYASSAMPITQLTFNSCTNSTCSNAPMYYHSSSGKYDYSAAGGVSSGFARSIKISFSGNEETIVKSTVYWAQGSNNYSITFSENLTSWIE